MGVMTSERVRVAVGFIIPEAKEGGKQQSS
jgi:hypothetical protein